MFSTSALAASACPVNAEGVRHFVITLEDHANSSVSPIVWGAVVGCEGARGCEQFTPRELIEFPIYIWRNHSGHWTGLPWWLTLANFFSASIAVVIVRELLRTCFGTVRESHEARAASKGGAWFYAVAVPRVRVHEREGLYDLAILGWTWAMLDMTVHYFVALTADDLSDDPEDLAFANAAFWVGVIAWGNLLPLTITLLCWWGTRKHFGPDRRFGDRVMYAWWTRPDIWAFAEILTGVSWFFNFGAGYYVGPSATVVAGLLRLGEIRNMGEPFWMQPWNSTVPDGASNTQRKTVESAGLGTTRFEPVVAPPAAALLECPYYNEAESDDALLPALCIKQRVGV